MAAKGIAAVNTVAAAADHVLTLHASLIVLHGFHRQQLRAYLSETPQRALLRPVIGPSILQVRERGKTPHWCREKAR